jgi:hypothetical protein
VVPGQQPLHRLDRFTDNHETAYIEEVRYLTVWCQDNNLSLNFIKTKKLIVDYREWRADHAPPIHNDGAEEERVASFKFFGVHITKELTWSTHTNTVVKKACLTPLPPGG